MQLRDSNVQSEELRKELLSDAVLRAKSQARARCYPSICSAAYLELRSRRILMEHFVASMERVDCILDVGSQYSPYRDIFQNKYGRFLSMDMVKTPLVDIVCNAEAMTLDDNSIDLVICTQVLEHCERPERIISECHRVLKPGGRLIVTVPSVFPEHGYPADNWRFMPQGLELMLREFTAVTVMGEMDFAASWISTNVYYIHTLTGKFRVVQKFADPVLHVFLNLLALSLGRILNLFTRRNFRAFSANLWSCSRK